ncbi:acyl-CoA thioesterase II [Paracoccus sp. J55]|uniref:acyl-CoA thioesterase n=1 Tax=Paracoccus sp. J55 TaxID=935849 RepID=UPI00048E3B61|nr:acyl-CoA thioesterase domain-containing protein [Paracoccus sp. J55]
MRDQPNTNFGVGDLIALVIPERIGAGRFLAASPLAGTPRVFGGQYVAQAIMAAAQMVGPERILHRISGDFILPGRIDGALDIDVTSLHQGRSFTLCRVDFRQDDGHLFTATLSFQAPQEGDAHLGDAPPLPDPLGWPTEEEYLSDIGAAPDDSPQISPGFFAMFCERRSRSWRDETANVPGPARGSYWTRLAEPLSAHADRFDPALEAPLHQALIGYFSDLGLLATGARPLGYGSRHPDTRSASLSHAMLFHAPQRADEWHFSAMTGLGVNRNRASAMARIYDQDGKAVITAMQEGVIRHHSHN